MFIYKLASLDSYHHFCKKFSGDTPYTDLKVREKWKGFSNPSSKAISFTNLLDERSSDAACPIFNRIRNLYGDSL
jgi:hypothetical protein